MSKSVITPWQKTSEVFELVRSFMYPSALQLFDCIKYNCIADKTSLFVCPAEEYINHYSTTYEQLTKDFLFISSFQADYRKPLKRPRECGFLSLFGTSILGEDYIEMRLMPIEGEGKGTFIEPSESKFINSDMYWQISYGGEPMVIDLKERARQGVSRKI